MTFLITDPGALGMTPFMASIAPDTFTDNWLTADNTKVITILWARVLLNITPSKQQPQDKPQRISTMGLSTRNYGESTPRLSPC